MQILEMGVVSGEDQVQRHGMCPHLAMVSVVLIIDLPSNAHG